MRLWSFNAFPQCPSLSSTLQHVSLTLVWGTDWCHNSLLWSQGCNRKEGCILPYSDQSPLGHHTYDGYARGNTFLTLKLVTEVLHDHSFPEGNPAHKLQFTLWTGVPKILKLCKSGRMKGVSGSMVLCISFRQKEFHTFEFFKCNIVAWSMYSVCQPSFCPLKIRHMHMYVRRHTQDIFTFFF
jgi:hypothetical protein